MTAADAASGSRPAVRFDWTRAEAEALYGLPFPELLHRAQLVHRESFDPAAVETASLLSIKTGGCPEDCGYCSQSARYDTGVKATRLMEAETVVDRAARAKAAGAGRFCMGAAWRSLKDRDLDRVCEMVAGVKALGMSTCVTLGMLTRPQADRLKAAGLDYYSHNVDTSPEFYGRIITTRTLQDRLETLEHVRAAGIKVCCGGIVGMGETVDDRLGMLLLLAGMDPHPESVPLNLWNEVAGTPVMEMAEKPDPIGFVRLVAVARILLPRSVLRLSAGRQYMSDELQALCFVAGANSIFLGDVLLTTANPGPDRDTRLLEKLGLRTVTGGLVPA
ncbi:biotin synthase BioB [Inquilinus sp. Marseille-Q2685]|uniref:biotin synthase BioB n=1 Tax=Inquilinus sp. Marseille-Q2685 TaxID=2866581 RepID=UPI001CE3C600|nr:biotin synthase BioB [Inquilinus sp. Marseille-Q2685]